MCKHADLSSSPQNSCKKLRVDFCACLSSTGERGGAEAGRALELAER